MKLLVDNNLPPPLARAIHLLVEPDHHVVALRDRFRQNAKDEEWIPALGREGGWAVLSEDLAIARKRPSRDLFFRSGLVGFFLGRTMHQWPLTRKAARILTIWPQMVAHMDTTASGLFEIRPKGQKFEAIGR